MQTDKQLIQSVLAGNRDHFASLIQRYERQVHTVAWGIVRDHQIAEDVTQETFLKAYGKLGTLHAPEEFGSWILSIARHVALDVARTKPRAVLVATVPEIPSVELNATDGAAELLTALATLSDNEQQVLLYRYFDNRPVAEIAEILGSPVGTITKRLSRAIVSLRDRLKGNS